MMNKRAAGIPYVISHKDGQHLYLSIKRRKEDGGFWQYVTGTVEDAEAFRDALIREMQEETGFNPSQYIIKPPVHTFIWQKNNKPVYEIIYPVHFEWLIEPTLSEEHTNWSWADYPTTRDRYVSEDNRYALDVLEMLITSGGSYAKL